MRWHQPHSGGVGGHIGGGGGTTVIGSTPKRHRIADEGAATPTGASAPVEGRGLLAAGASTVAAGAGAFAIEDEDADDDLF